MLNREKDEKVALRSILITFFLVLIKILAYFLSGSIAIFADAIHSLTDTVSSLLVFLGIVFSKKKTKKFPYGLYKLENFASLILSIIIFFAGFEIIKEAFQYKTLTRNYFWPLGVAFISSLISFLLSNYKLKAGKEVNSPSLIADGIHSRTDALSSIIVFFGVGGGLLNFPLEKAAAVIVALFIFRASFELLSNSVKVLLDASIDMDTMIKIRDIIMDFPQVTRIITIKGRNSGRFVFVEAILEMDVNTLEEAHGVSEEIEKAIKKEIKYVESVLIHYEPLKKELKKAFIPVKEDKPTLHIGEADEFVIVEKYDDKFRKIGRIPNPARLTDKGKGRIIMDFVEQEGIDAVILPSPPPDKHLILMLKSKGIRIFIEENVSKILSS